jgi:hypothetical protein
MAKNFEAQKYWNAVKLELSVSTDARFEACVQRLKTFCRKAGPPYLCPP